jgi:hypothetical protein
MTDLIYAQPPSETASLENCYFYHTIDLPGYGTIHGSWDLREHLDEYLGFVDFKDKRATFFTVVGKRV